MFKPNEEMLKLKAFFEQIPRGTYVSYTEIQSKTGIKMNDRGKQLMRSALRSLHYEYNCNIGNGIELESEKNCMAIVTGRMRRVSSGLKRADKTTMRMTERYLDELPPEHKNRLLATASLFGAIKAMAKGLSAIYKAPKLINVKETGKIPKTW